MYSALARDWHLLHPPRLAAVDFLAQRAGEPPARVVDVGAASGEYAALLQRRGFEAYAVDVSHALCEQARARHPQLAGVVHGDMLEIFDLVRGPVQLAYCIGGALCELATEREVEDVVAQLFDLVRPGGCVVLEVPSFEHLRAQARRLAQEVAEGSGEVRYGGLEDSGHPSGSPQLGSISEEELRLYLPPVSAFRADGSELRLERQYCWRQGQRGPALRWQFAAPEGDGGGELPLLELTRHSVEESLPSHLSAQWYGGWDGAAWTERSGSSIAVLRP